MNVQRTRAEVRKLVGEIRVETTEDAIDLWSAQSGEQALARVAGGLQQENVVAGVRSGTLQIVINLAA